MLLSDKISLCSQLGLPKDLMEELRRKEIIKFHLSKNGKMPYKSNEKGENNGYWYVKVIEDGKIKRLSSKTEEGIYDKLVDYYDNQNSLKDIFNEWHKSTEGTRNPLTHRNDLYDYNFFFKDTDVENKNLSKITIQDYYRLLTSKELSTKDLSRFHTLINNIYKYAVLGLGLDINNPLKETSIDAKFLGHIKKKNYEDEYYTSEEIRTLQSYILNENNPTNTDLAILLCTLTGMRVGEIRGLKKENIIDKGPYFILRIRECVDRWNNPIDTKCGIHREIPIDKEMFLFILNHIHSENNNSNYLFTRKNSSLPLHGNTINSRLKVIAEKCNIVPRSIHKIRFGVVSLLFEQGCEGYEIQKMVGHTSITMTEHYNRSKKTVNSDILTYLSPTDLLLT